MGGWGRGGGGVFVRDLEGGFMGKVIVWDSFLLVRAEMGWDE
jgi:hypothetical protein